MKPTRKVLGRPLKIESEKTVVSGQGTLVSYSIHPSFVGSSTKWEMVTPDELIGKKGYGIYREMINDDQVKASLWFKKMLVLGRAWDVAPADDDEESIKIATWVEDRLKELKLKDILFEILTAFDFGVCFGEIIWEPRRIESELQIVVKDVAFRDPSRMHIDTDLHGNIIQFRQDADAYPLNSIAITPDKMFHWAYNGTFRNHWGISDLRAAYRAWWSKKYVTQFFNVFLERFGSPMTAIKYPVGSTDELKNNLARILTNLTQKSEILIPDGVKIELIEAQRSGSANFEGALATYDVGIANAILMPAMLGGGTTDRRGSDSQSRLHLRVLMKLVQHICEQVSDKINCQIIEPMVNMNYDVKKCPKFTFQDYGEFQAFEISDAILQLHNGGVLELDAVDTNYIRSILGMRVRPEGEEDEVNRPDPLVMMPGGNDQANGGGAASGNKRAKKGESQKKTNRPSATPKPQKKT